MKKIILSVLFLSLFFLTGSFSNILAQQPPIKGNWTFTIFPDGGGALPVPFVFKNKGKGTVATPLGISVMVYREDGTTFSLVTEIPKILPDGTDATFLMRGTKMADGSVKGFAFQISDKPDPASPIGLLFFSADFTGIRDK